MYAKKKSVPFVITGLHCESAITINLLLQQKHCSPSIAYIGCSKLTYLCCWYMVAAIRVGLGLDLRMQGTHGKVYWPWRYPTQEIMAAKLEAAHQVEQIFSNRITETYINCIKENRIELQSDSTAIKSTLSTTGDMLTAVYNSREARRQRSFPVVSASAAPSVSHSHPHDL